MIAPATDQRSSRGHYITCAFCGGMGCPVCATKITRDMLARDRRDEAQKCVEMFEEAIQQAGIWNQMHPSMRTLIEYAIHFGRQNGDERDVQAEDVDHLDRFRNLELRGVNE